MVSAGIQCSNSDKIPCRCERIQNADGFFEVHVNCSGKRFTEIPASLPSFVTVLDVSHNQLLPEKLHTLCQYVNIANVSLAYNALNELPAHQLSDCYIHNSIDLEGNVFNSITAEALDGLENTKSIFGLEAQRFDNNTFKKFGILEQLSMKAYQTLIPEDLFDSLKLKYLDLTVSGALQLPSNLLQFGSTTLQVLYLRSKSLQTIPNDFFKALVEIEVITIEVDDVQALPVDVFAIKGEDLYELRITGVNSLPSGVFNGLHRLSRLEIHDMRDFSYDLFEGLMELTHLDLSHSDFGFGTVQPYLFANQWGLKSLKLSDCRITSIEENSFEGQRSLEILNLSSNSIRYLTGRPFKNMRNSVKEISLKASDISVIEATVFEALLELTTLDLSENNLYKLDENIFSDLIKLEHLFLYRNKLTYLPSGLFNGLTALTTLNLAYNILEEDPGSLLVSARDLSVLNLSDNSISKLSYSLTDNLVGLTVLNVGYNPLNCDCKMIQIRNILLQRNVQIVAQCSNPSYKSLKDAVILDCPEVSPENMESDFSVTTGFRFMASSVELPARASSTETQQSVRSTSAVAAASAGMYTPSPTTFTAAIPGHDLDKPRTTSTTGFTPQISKTRSAPKAITDEPVSSISSESHLPITPSTVSGSDSNLLNIKPGHSAAEASDPDDTGLSAQTKFYIAVGFISFVSFISVAILVCLACKRMRSRSYEVSEVFSGDIEFEKFLDSTSETSIQPSRSGTPIPRDRGNSLGALKAVPSVQIDVVHDDGHVSTVTYQAADIPDIE